MSQLPGRIQPIYAALIMRAAGLEPLEPYRGYDQPWACRCTQCGKLVRPRFRQIRDGAGGCRSCGLRARHARRRARTVDTRH
ncbi:hypothetical protein [Streptomyces sp. NPDC054765]